jgi:hypothetical protein|tara:strand:- start:791 stop:1693 length:903 start_codon:yes stop_codon:yes gene_type:complete
MKSNEMKYTQYQMNDWIIDKLKSNQPFSCVRLGNTEYNLIENIIQNQQIPDVWINYTHSAGIFPHTYEFCRDKYYPKIDESLQNADAIGHPGCCSKDFSKKFKQLYFNNKICYTECRFLDPIYLSNYSDPWTKYLKGKKVLVVNSSASSIEKQWDNIDNIWGDKRELICPFELVDVIRSPFSPSVCGGDIFYGDKKINDWIESSEMICDFIDDVDFDIALIGAGAYAPVLASYIKSKNKSVVTTCGATQLFFGVKGKRWTENDNNAHHKVIDDNWIFPIKEDLPTNLKFIESFEGGNAYW